MVFILFICCWLCRVVVEARNLGRPNHRENLQEGFSLRQTNVFGRSALLSEEWNGLRRSFN